MIKTLIWFLNDEWMVVSPKIRSIDRKKNTWENIHDITWCNNLIIILIDGLISMI